MQAVEVDWLRHVAIETNVVRGALKAAGVERCDCNYGDCAQAFALAYLPRGFQSVNVRHRQVHQNYLRVSQVGHAHGLFAVRGRHYAVAVALKVKADERQVINKIINDHHKEIIRRAIFRLLLRDFHRRRRCCFLTSHVEDYSLTESFQPSDIEKPSNPTCSLDSVCAIHNQFSNEINTAPSRIKDTPRTFVEMSGEYLRVKSRLPAMLLQNGVRAPAITRLLLTQ